MNSLTGIYGLTKDEIGSIIKNAGIDPARRAETLQLQEFAALANMIRPKNN